MGASSIRFENWLPPTTNSGVQWWPSPPAPNDEPARVEPRRQDDGAADQAGPMPLPAPVADDAAGAGPDRQPDAARRVLSP